MAPVAGGVGAAEVEAAGIDPSDASHLSISGLTGAAAREDKEAIMSYIRKRYGNHAEVVIQILTAWEEYHELFSEWRAEWTDDSDEYRAMRALQLARRGRDFQAALTSLSNYK